MIKDYATAKDRLSFEPEIIEETFLEGSCEGCDRTPDNFKDDEDIPYSVLEDNCVFTRWGSWYCHDDCYRDCNN
jgi:hypothetical protein